MSKVVTIMKNPNAFLGLPEHTCLNKIDITNFVFMIMLYRQ